MKTIKSQTKEVSIAKTIILQREEEIKSLHEAVAPVVHLFTEAEDSSRVLVEAVIEVHGRLKVYVKDIARTCIRQILGLVRVLFPAVDLCQVAEALLSWCMDERLS